MSRVIKKEKVKDKQLPETDVIRTKVPPSKSKWEITKITISQEHTVNRMSSYLPKGGYSVKGENSTETHRAFIILPTKIHFGH